MADIILHNFYYMIALGKIDWDSDVIKYALCTSGLTSPMKDYDTWESGSDPYDSEISGGNGYTAGGEIVTCTITDQDSPNFNVKFDISNVTFTASGGSIGPFRYGVLYADSVNSPQVKPLIYIRDYLTDQTITNGSTWTDNIDADGLFTIG